MNQYFHSLKYAAHWFASGVKLAKNHNQLGISWTADAFADGSVVRLERFEREIPHLPPTATK